MKSIGGIIDLTVVPCGNCMKQGNAIQCQHGPEECKANMILDCAINFYPNSTQYLPFLYCQEGSDNPITSVSKCASKAGLDGSKIEKCAKGPEGKKLLMAAYKATPPAHQYVPWVVVDGKVLSDPSTLESSVCKAYKGTKPAGCSAKEHMLRGQIKSNTTEPCYPTA